MQTFAPELNLTIGPRTDDHRWETDRPGFTVHAEAQGGREVGYLHAFEGYTLGERDGQEVVVEPDTLHIQYVSAVSRLPYGLGEPITGVGTVLIRRAVEYAVEGGFAYGRTEPINPRVISILQKLQHEGTIGGLELYSGNPLLQTVERLRETGELVVPAYAKELLEKKYLRPTKSANFCVRAIFDL